MWEHDVEPRIVERSPMRGVALRIHAHAGDLGAQGRMQPTGYIRLIEHAIDDYWRWTEYLAGGAQLNETVIDWRLSVETPVARAGALTAHLWVPRRGKLELTYGFAVLSHDMAIRHASGYRRVRHLDEQTQRPVRLCGELWDHAEALLSPASPTETLSA